MMKRIFRTGLAVGWLVFILSLLTAAQSPATKAQLGSRTAQNGFRNETEIAGKFRNWKTDADANRWLAAMGFDPASIESVSATKPHGEKSDVVVKIRTHSGEFEHGISIKLVSGTTGFNQIDKRWLSHYAEMWKMPKDVVAALKFFLGEVLPNGPSRRPERMYFNEMDAEAREAVLRFFTENREMIVSDLLEGDGPGKAKWFMVAQKNVDLRRSVIVSMTDAIKFFGEGKVEFTRNGNLKIGRISMQRKGGDAGRPTAKMLQFKLNPAALFSVK